MGEYLYLDIETIGCPTPEQVVEITNSITVPGNYKKPETVAEWEANIKPGLVKDALAKTSLNGIAGQICCIGWAWGDAEPQAFNGTDGEEALLIDAMYHIHKDKPGGYQRPIIVGHNVAGFDLRFLWQRAFVLGIKLPAWFPRDPKPWAENVHDTMIMWGGARDYVNLDTLSRAMGLPGKGNVTGADVAGMWERGEYDAISAYCHSDVERVRSVHRKMMVAYGEVA